MRKKNSFMFLSKILGGLFSINVIMVILFVFTYKPACYQNCSTVYSTMHEPFYFETVFRKILFATIFFSILPILINIDIEILKKTKRYFKNRKKDKYIPSSKKVVPDKKEIKNILYTLVKERKLNRKQILYIKEIINKDLNSIDKLFIYDNYMFENDIHEIYIKLNSKYITNKCLVRLYIYLYNMKTLYNNICISKEKKINNL